MTIHGRGCPGQEGGQIRTQLLAALVAVLGPRRQRLHGDLIQLGRNSNSALRGRHDLRVAHPFQQGVLFLPRCTRGTRAGGEKLPAGEQLPQDHARGVDVAATVESFRARLFRRHVADLAVDHPRGSLLQFQGRGGQAEVGQLDLARIGEQHVGRRYVAVDETETFKPVGIGQAPHQLLDDVGGHWQRESDAFLGATVPHRPQVLALDEFHGEVDLALDLARLEHTHQVSVVEAHDHLGFVLEPLHVASARQVRQGGLDHAQLLQAPLPVHRKIECPHAPASQGLDQYIPAEASRKTVHGQQRACFGCYWN